MFQLDQDETHGRQMEKKRWFWSSGKDEPPACSGSPTEKTGPSGGFGISRSEYKNRAQCGWKIRVKSGKVTKGSEPPVFVFIFYCADLTKQNRTMLIIIAPLSFTSPRGHSKSQISSSDSCQESPYTTGGGRHVSTWQSVWLSIFTSVILVRVNN